MEQHYEAVAARIGQLQVGDRAECSAALLVPRSRRRPLHDARCLSPQAKDLPAALQGLLRQAETALRPASKGDRARRPATPAPQKRSLVVAILLLLDRTGRELDRQAAVYQVRRCAVPPTASLPAATAAEPTRHGGA